MMMINKLTILLSFIFMYTTSVSSQFNYKNSYCIETQGSYTSNSTYKNNLKPLFVYLTNQALSTSFGNYSVGEGIDKVNMIYNCRGDINYLDCHSCIKEASEKINTNCPTSKESIIWYQECMLRYSNRSIFSMEDESSYAWDDGVQNVSDPTRYNRVVKETVDGLIKEAAYNVTKAGYAAGEGNVEDGIVAGRGGYPGDKVYCYVQCSRDIIGSQCERCLRAAFSAIAGCCGTNRESMEFYFPSCQIHYTSIAFTRGNGNGNSPVLPNLPPSWPTNSSPTPTKGSSKGTRIKSDGDISVFCFLMAVSLFFIMPNSN